MAEFFEELGIKFPKEVAALHQCVAACIYVSSSWKESVSIEITHCALVHNGFSATPFVCK